MRQIIPIFLFAPAQAYSNYNFQLIAGINGWTRKITDANYNQIGPISKADYGDLTGQFNRLANVWSTYTVEAVYSKFTPSNTSAGVLQSPTASIVDVVGGNNSGDFAQTLAVYNRSATIQYHDPFKACSRTLLYSQWLE